MSDNSLKKGRYTRYSNKIGLYSTSQDRIGFLNNNTDVVLSFPFKDTVLEAGMSKEDSGRFHGCSNPTTKHSTLPARIKKFPF